MSFVFCFPRSGDGRRSLLDPPSSPATLAVLGSSTLFRPCGCGRLLIGSLRSHFAAHPHSGESVREVIGEWARGWCVTTGSGVARKVSCITEAVHTFVPALQVRPASDVGPFRSQFAAHPAHMVVVHVSSAVSTSPPFKSNPGLSLFT
jgi:hypothetical protein